jgi:crotonobetainyl-CoA:carnitine CoA-transferase CaiB-like acyl-CoA transferase
VERMSNTEWTAEILQRCYTAAADLTTAEAIGRLEEEQVPCGVVIAPDDLAADPHAQAIGLLVDSDSPTAGRLRQPRHPTQFGTIRPALGGPAPTLGQHTVEVLGELGYADRVDALRAAAVIG